MFASGAYAQDPPLPPGLAPQEPKQPAQGEPVLPPGLVPAQPQVDEPPLPPGLDAPADAEAPPAQQSKRLQLLQDLHGFWETRVGFRVQEDDVIDRDLILGEARLQLDWDRAWDRVALDITGDLFVDGVTETVETDLRQLRVTWTPVDSVDIRIGRQVLTWGTGDLIFINDLFPKDWVAFFIGRDVEYLKAPQDAIKVSWFNEAINIELVYTPQFESDRFVMGERISAWNPLRGRRTGRDARVKFDAPSDYFSEDEFALRLYRTVGAFELAAYAYDGFWKSPGGQSLLPFRAIFPRLRVFGASIRGPIGRGMMNAEFGYYDSRDDSDGDRPLIENSQIRLLVGYEREIGKEFTAGVQYYLEHTRDYDAFRDTLPFFIENDDRNRHVVTLRLTKLLMQQDLTLSLFAFLSPSDADAYLRPYVSYKITDDWQISGGANLFFGREDHTFFSQFENNTNVYAAVRYSF